VQAIKTPEEKKYNKDSDPKTPEEKKYNKDSDPKLKVDNSKIKLQLDKVLPQLLEQDEENYKSDRLNENITDPVEPENVVEDDDEDHMEMEL
jgi:hypothetical protein